MTVRAFVICAGLVACFIYPSPPARAADGVADGAVNCDVAYQNVAHDYWVIISDMLQFKSMFDHYDKICTTNAPETIEKLQPTADQLRTQVKRDITDARATITHLFDTKFASMVPPACKDDTKSRNGVKKSFLKNMDEKSTITNKRLEKSRHESGANDPALELCAQLPPLKKQITKRLGPDLAHPLLEMATLHSSLIRHAPKQRKKAFAIYRAALKDATRPNAP